MSGDGLRKLGRFLIVGLGATVLYAMIGFILARIEGLPSTAASGLAYAAAAVISYAGHRSVTFRSDRAHAAVLPQFLAMNGVGLAIALGCAFACEAARLPAEIALLATCAIVPLLNFVVLDRLVFPARRAFPGSPE